MIKHPIKTEFLFEVEEMIRRNCCKSILKISLMDVLEYVSEGEHQDGLTYWDNFSTGEVAYSDFLRWFKGNSRDSHQSLLFLSYE